MKTQTAMRERKIVAQLLIIERATALGIAARRREIEAHEAFRHAKIALKELGVPDDTIETNWQTRTTEGVV